MTQEPAILKGIHPGFVLKRKIEEKKLKKGQLALSVREYPKHSVYRCAMLGKHWKLIKLDFVSWVKE